MKSSIYFAGFYKVIETEDILIKKLENIDDSSVKILIALALYRMESDKAMEVISNIAEKEADKEVRRMFTAIVDADCGR